MPFLVRIESRGRQTEISAHYPELNELSELSEVK